VNCEEVHSAKNGDHRDFLLSDEDETQIFVLQELRLDTGSRISFTPASPKSDRPVETLKIKTMEFEASVNLGNTMASSCSQRTLKVRFTLCREKNFIRQESFAPFCTIRLKIALIVENFS
jgi:hypothetical protein